MHIVFISEILTKCGVARCLSFWISFLQSVHAPFNAQFPNRKWTGDTKIRGWDENGLPTAERLKALGLEEIANALLSKG